MGVYQGLVVVVLLGFLRLVIRNLEDYAALPGSEGSASGGPYAGGPDLTELASAGSGAEGSGSGGSGSEGSVSEGLSLEGSGSGSSSAGSGAVGLVSVLAPARNEASNIDGCLAGLLAQTYPRLEILVLDDNSEDDTAARVLRHGAGDGRLRLLRGEPLPPGWAGKAWACHQLSQAAAGEWLLFVDADTRAQPGLVTAAVDDAARHQAAMVSGFPRQVTGSFWEEVVVPMVHFVLLVFLPIRQVWDSPSPAFAAACGQFELFRAAAYREIGGHEAVRGSFHDGLQLARKIKAGGGRLRLFDVSNLMQCRMYRSGAEVWNGFTRNAYEGIGSLPALGVVSGLQVALFLGPFCFLIAGAIMGAAWTWLCAAQVAVVLLIRFRLALRFGGWLSAVLHPLSLISLAAIEWGSYFRSRRRRRGTWKGRPL